MNIIILSLSSRMGSQSRRVSDYLAGQLESFGEKVELLNFFDLKLPIYDDSKEGAWKVVWNEIAPKLEAADGFVAVSPEWDGMAAPQWFNMLHYVNKEMAHKPVMLVGVSNGRGGAYPIAQMKQVGQKNNQFVISPENLIVGGVDDMLLTNVLDEKAPDYTIKLRADYALKILIEYAKALQKVRNSGLIDFKNFKNGV